ncbi:unnamed protein product [Brassica napus]|uniref:(rape) hypothetical protein n=1 Tax=Brassica napus TaxID=3708 RepID=A0A816RR07_BRANA|nr:unnamed protein product [Brassica napus]
MAAEGNHLVAEEGPRHHLAVDDKSGTITEVLAEDGKLASVNTGHRYKNLDQERNSKRKQRNEDVHSSPSIENINSLKNELQNGFTPCSVTSNNHCKPRDHIIKS